MKINENWKVMELEMRKGTMMFDSMPLAVMTCTIV